MNVSEKERTAALNVVTSSIARCEKMVPKFPQGTTQHSLLKNRIQALRISESLLKQDDSVSYSKVELEKALAPILSIQSKTTHARDKYMQGTTQYKRFTPIIEAMKLCHALIEDALKQRI